VATESELKIKLIAEEDDITKWWREHGEKEFRMKFASTGAAGFKPPPGFDASERPSGVTAPFSSTDADLERRYKPEHMKYMNQELKFMNAASSAGGAASNIAGAFFGMKSGGLGGLAKSLNAEIQKMGRGGGFTNLITGAVAARGTGRALGGAAAAGAEGEGAALSGAALVGFGGFASIAAKIGSAVVTAVTAGADVASRDIYTRYRRTSGYGMGGEGGFGKITAFDDVTSRYVNPDNVLAAMRDAKYPGGNRASSRCRSKRRRFRSTLALASRLRKAAERLSLRCCSGTPPSAHRAFCSPSASATKLCRRARHGRVRSPRTASGSDRVGNQGFGRRW
jgi:hypothetical protein